MQKQLLSVLLVAAGLTALAVGSWAQTPTARARDALVDMLVWGADLPVDLKAFPPEVKTELETHLQRSKAYRSKRGKPASRGLEEILYGTLVRYERKLAAVSGDPNAPALAAAYVDALRPCYEWEGYHDCPEKEAQFAAAYRKDNPGGPFSDYLPLLEAHRWLCAAEAYDYEKQPEGATRSRRAYEETISKARQSKSPLVRLASERLAERNHCNSRH